MEAKDMSEQSEFSVGSLSYRDATEFRERVMDEGCTTVIKEQ
jgi:hypothetical protein